MITPGNRNEITVFAALLDAVPPVRGKAGRPRRRPTKLHADKAYDFPVARRQLRARGILARIARRGVHSSVRLGRHRWVVERTFAWLGQSRRLSKDYERLPATSETMIYGAMSRLMLRRLTAAPARPPRGDVAVR